jgi:hypothetical protein
MTAPDYVADRGTRTTTQLTARKHRQPAHMLYLLQVAHRTMGKIATPQTSVELTTITAAAQSTIR